MQAVDDCEEASPPSGDRYRMGEIIGSGGLGEVYRAEDTQLCRLVAVKRLLGVNGSPSEASAKILQEARHLASLQHPNIVTVYDVIANRGDVVVVMELLQGRTLQEIAEKAPLSLEEFADVMRQALEGLVAAHAQGMLHRDIKPSNLMLSQLPSGATQLKILDFGMAKVAPEPSSQTKDQDGALMGSIYMMSPEQLEGSPLDARSDLYSLGCVAYFSLTAQYPFTGKTVVEVITAHLQGRRVPLHELRSDLSPPVCEWVDRLMAIKPKDRPVSASMAFEELKRALGKKQTKARPKPVVEKPRQPWRLPKVRMADIGVGILLVAICVFCYIQLVPSHGFGTSSETANINVREKASFLALEGKPVTVEGIVARVSSDKGGGFRRLIFEGTVEGDLTLVFFSTESPAELMRELSNYVGRKIRVSGKVTVQDGAPQIFVDSFSQLETL